MELWIRSQNRCMITKVNNIFIREYDSQLDNIFHKFAIASAKDNSCDHIILGIYEKERAKEILDDIQSLLEGNILSHHINKFDIYNGENIKVYEMPET